MCDNTGFVITLRDPYTGQEVLLPKIFPITALEEKISLLWEMLASNTGCTFDSLFAARTRRADIVLSFLALLEMIRRRLIRIVQPTPFGEIYIRPIQQ